ncbi:MAG: M55 family metallopeptidase [Armatimonadota bacterium]
MKIYILTDLEGAGGVINRSHVFSDQPGYPQARHWLTMDVNAAVEGAIAGGATEILVLDGHGGNGACNFLYDELHPGAQYIQGAPYTQFPQGLDDSFDGFFFVGAHAMAGTPGAILEHTMSSMSWVEMRINGAPTGEIGLFAAAAGMRGVPFVMVSGDDKACLEAASISPDVECAVVKEGISRHCAKLLPPAKVRELIKEKARLGTAKIKSIQPVKIDGPVEIQIRYFRNDLVEAVHEREGVRKVDPQSVVFSGKDLLDAWKKVMGG